MRMCDLLKIQNPGNSIWVGSTHTLSVAKPGTEVTLSVEEIMEL